jgi:DNA-3-methyladenine glycosylase II
MVESYISHCSKDKKLKTLLEHQELVRLTKSKNIYLDLCSSIMSQQLSTKVAAVIYKRFLALFSGAEPKPEQIIALPFDTLRGIGLSNAKTRYIFNVASFTLEHGMDSRKLSKMSNDEVITYLTQIKGVGKWTAEMLLMFTLGREDVFAIDDLGLQNAMIKLYKLDNSDKKLLKEKLLKISAKWSPYRTFACIHLWRWKDTK